MPSVRLTWRNFGNGLWLKGPRENNPPGTLRRATSVYPLRTGSVRSRSQITQLDAIASAHSLFKFAGERIVGAATTIYRTVTGTFTNFALAGTQARTGSALTFVAAPPTVGKRDYVFVAGGGAPTTNPLIKLDPTLNASLISKWGISPATVVSKPDAAAATRDSKVIDSFDTASSWTVTDADDDDSVTVNATKAQATGKKVEGTASLRFRVPKDSTTRADKAITVDLSQYASNPSADEDYIEFFIAVNRPRHVKNIELVFYVGSAAPGDFDDETDTYSRELTFKTIKKKKKRTLLGTGDLIRRRDESTFIADNALSAADFSLAEQVAEDTIGVTRRTWTRVTLPKASFDANGNAGQTGKTWADVKAVRISVETNKLGRSRVWLDGMRMIGGVGMQGDYQYMFTWRNDTTGTRSNPFPTKVDSVTGATVFDPVQVRAIERQGVVLGGVTALPAPDDAQVSHLEIWRTVGNGTGFFLADKTASTTGTPATTYTDRVADYPGMFSGNPGGTKFLQAEELPDDNDRPNDYLTDAVAFLGRMWLAVPASGQLLDQRNRAWYSPAGRMEAVANYAEIGSTDEAIAKLVVWNETLWAVTTRTVYRLSTTDEPFVFVELVGTPGTRFPRSVAATPFGIVYQAQDGFRIFDGNGSQLVGDDALAPLTRGSASDGISAFSAAAATFARGEYVVSDANTTLGFSPDGGWRNIGVPCVAFHWESDTRVLLAIPTISATTRIASFEGDANGEQGGTVADTTNDVTTGALVSTFEIETGAPDSTGTAYLSGGVWGIARRILIEGQTENQAVTVTLVIDNTTVSLGTVSLGVGVKRVMEVACHRAGFIQGVRLTAAGLTKRIEISAIELDVYIPTPAAA